MPAVPLSLASFVRLASTSKRACILQEGWGLLNTALNHGSRQHSSSVGLPTTSKNACWQWDINAELTHCKDE